MPEKEGATGCLKPTVLPNQWVMLPDPYTVADLVYDALRDDRCFHALLAADEV